MNKIANIPLPINDENGGGGATNVNNGDDDDNVDVNVVDVSEASGNIAILGLSQGSL